MLVALVAGEDGPIAFPIGKGSGSVTTFSQADGFLEVDALRTAVDPGTRAQVTLIGQARAPDLVIAGSHCVALDAVLSALSAQGIAARTIAIGSMGGVAAARRGECDLAPIHLMDPATGIYNEHYAKDGLALVRGWQRMQGIVFRTGDARFEGKTRAGRAEGRARRSGLPHGQPQCRRRHAHPDRSAARRTRGRPATATSRARTMRSRPRSRRAAPTGASRSSRSPRCTGSASCSSRRRTTTFCWSRPARAARRRGVPQGAGRSGGARANRRARHDAGLSYNDAMKVIGIAGWSGAGKTTLLTRVIPRLDGARACASRPQARASRLRHRPAGQGLAHASRGGRDRGADLVGQSLRPDA